MATGEKNGNSDEYCLPSDLLAKKNTDLEDYNSTPGNIKSQQKLKDLLTKSDNNHNDFKQNQKDITPSREATQTDIGQSDNSFNSCVHDKGNSHITNRLDFNSIAASASAGRGGTFSSSKVIQSLSDCNFKYGPYRVPPPPFGVSTTKLLERVVNTKTLNNTIGNNSVEENSRHTSTPSSLIERVLTPGDEARLGTPGLYEDPNEFLFHDSSCDAPIRTKFEDDDEWEMALNAESRRSPVPMKNKPATHTLFIRQAGTTDTLRQQITEVLGESEITVLALEESFDVGTKADVYSLIWFHLLTPLNKRAIEIMSLLKSTGRNNILPIVVTNNPIEDKLPIQADLFVEPLTNDVIERLCSTVKASKLKNSSNVSSKHPTTVPNFAGTPESTISSASGRTSLGNHSPPRWCRMEHATKEKQRRERIKDSCDQLRVLLPYVKGRKTDMASILEMTVDYLKIVNSALSQDFHSQVIDIMSNGSPPPEDDYFSMNMAYKKTIKKDELDLDASSEKSFHAVLTKTETKASKTSKRGNLNMNNRMVTRSVSRSLTSVEDEIHDPDNNGNYARRNAYGNVNNRIVVTKRGCSATKVGSSVPKKPYMTVASQDNRQSRTIQASSTTSVLKDYKTENSLDDQSTQNHPYANIHQFPHMFTEGDISANRMFSSGHVASNDGFAYISHSQINLQSTHNAAVDRSDVNNYANVYFDGSYLPYSYSSLQDSNNNNGNYYGTEYVNPNAVLPVTSYMPRVSAFASGRKFERPALNAEMLQCDSDVYNNNAV